MFYMCKCAYKEWVQKKMTYAVSKHVQIRTQKRDNSMISVYKTVQNQNKWYELLHNHPAVWRKTTLSGSLLSSPTRESVDQWLVSGPELCQLSVIW